MKSLLGTGLFVLVATLVLAAVGIAGEGRHAPASEPPPVPPEPPGGRAFTVAADMRDPIELKRVLEPQLSKEMAGAGYEEDRIAALADRLASLLSVQASGTYDDYLKLARNWGGHPFCEELEPDKAAECDRACRAKWRRPDQGIDKYSTIEIGVRALDREGLGVALKSIRLPRGQGVIASAGNINYPANRDKLVSGKADVVLICVPVSDYRQQSMVLMYHFVWDPMSNGWLPWHVYVMGDQQLGVPTPNF